MNTKAVFKKGSTTYFVSSIFFPRIKRKEVSLLYAFVRIADDFVDTVPAKKKEFFSFKKEFEKAWAGKSNSALHNDVVSLAKKYDFKKSWFIAFFNSMEMDLYKKNYTFKELKTYIYGSAEVIGLMLSRLLYLDRKLDAQARKFGASMQLINMIRDIKEDTALGRTYLSKELSFYMKYYKMWHADAQKAFPKIPYRYRVPIKTAADMYMWTARKIEKDSSIPYKYKLKPKKFHILCRGLYNATIKTI